MKFEVINKLGHAVMSTEYESCVYDDEDLADMAAAGYRFRVDGKVLTAPKKVRSVLDKLLHAKSENAAAPHNVDEESEPSSDSHTDTGTSQMPDARWEEDADSAQLQYSEPDVSTFAEDAQPEAPATKPLNKIRCIETGELFDKQSQAAKALGIDPAAVSDSLKTGRKRAGYTFERV